MRVVATDRRVANVADAAALAEVDRLDELLSAYRPDSAFNEWRRGESGSPPAELVEVLGSAASWHRRTGGAFSPCLGAVMARWRRAEVDGRLPDREELLELVAGAARLPFVVIDGRVVVRADCSLVDVHGVAKGWVIDEMTRAAFDVEGVSAVLVELGGDLCHRRTGSSADLVAVAVEHPRAVADNSAPLAVVELAGRAMATSGGNRRGWRIGDRWYGHLLDPATGWPLAEQSGATVIAPSAAEADAIASAAAVVDVDQIEMIAGGAAVLKVMPDGGVWRSPSWRDSVVEVQ